MIWSIKAVVKWVFDKFNNKVEDNLSDVEGEASNLLFDPSKTASFNRLSHMGKMTLIFESAYALESFFVISSPCFEYPQIIRRTEMSDENNQKNLLEIAFKVLSSLIIPFRYLHRKYEDRAKVDEPEGSSSTRENSRASDQG